LSDALASIQIIRKGAAQTSNMQIIHDKLADRPEFDVIVRGDLQEHIFGEVNV
jgi:hypothetical protein